jgi:hypothetical protein
MSSFHARPQATTDADGRFQLCGELLGSLALVEPWLTGYSTLRDAPPVLLDPASQPELLLTLVREGEVRTCVILARPPAHKLVWQLSIGSRVVQVLELGPKEGAGRIERDVRNVPPGTYRARLADYESGASVFGDIEGILVRPGERTNDPRLCGVDLSHAAVLSDAGPKGDARGKAITLDVLDASGKPLADGRIVPTGVTRDGDAHWHSGRVILDASARGQEITVWSPGFRAWVGACPEGSTSLRLERAPRLSLHVVIPAAFQRPDCRFRIWPEPAGGSNTALELVRALGSVELDADGTATFECPCECTVRFIMQALALDAGGGFMRDGLAPEPVTTIDLQLPVVDESHTITVSAEEWAAIEKLLGR